MLLGFVALVSGRPQNQDEMALGWFHEPIEPPTPEAIDKWVDIVYPSDSGLQRNLEAAGYRVARHGWV